MKKVTKNIVNYKLMWEGLVNPYKIIDSEII